MPSEITHGTTFSIVGRLLERTPKSSTCSFRLFCRVPKLPTKMVDLAKRVSLVRTFIGRCLLSYNITTVCSRLEPASTCSTCKQPVPCSHCRRFEDSSLTVLTSGELTASLISCPTQTDIGSVSIFNTNSRRCPWSLTLLLITT